MLCFTVVMVGWIFSVCLHEYGHAWVAYRGGDHTVEEKGYLEMNPIHYTHPVTSFLLPILFMAMGGIGLPGGAVYINKSLLRSRGWDTAVSLAGPAMNLFLAIFLALLLRAYFMPELPNNAGTYALAFLLKLQICAILFNLIPIPPLDGFQAIEPWLPNEWQERLLPMRNYGIFILVILMWNVHPLNIAFWSLVDWIVDFLGVDPWLASQGYFHFKFWEQ